MTREQQVQLARDAALAMARVVSLVGATPRANGRERTDAGIQDRLGHAVRAAECPEASQQWATATRLWWALALSERRMARHLARRFQRASYLADLEQEGLIGLFEAARRYNPDRGLAFSTYAAWWVGARIRRAVSLASAIEMPNRVAVAVSRRQREPHLTCEQLAVSASVLAAGEAATRIAYLEDAAVEVESPEGEDQLLEQVVVRQLLARSEGLHGEVLRHRLAGLSHGEIAPKLGLSRQRVWQLESELLAEVA